MVEVGGAIYLGWDPIPSNGYVTSIDWNSTSASNVAVSNTGLVVGLATDGGKPVKATITAQAKVGSDPVGSVVECEVTVYDKGTLSSTTGADLALLGWDLLLDYKNGANTSVKREAVTSAADIRVKALTKSEIKDMATLGSQALLSTKVDNPVYRDGTTVLAYYPVLKGAQYFDLDFARTGWSFVSMSGGVPTGTQSGNRISVSENGNMVEREIGYPVDGIDPANWPHITVRVIPCAEVTFSMPKALKDNLNADNLLLTADQGSTILLNLVSKSNTGAEALTGFSLGTADTSSPDVGYLKSSNGDLTRTALIWANFPDTKIRFLTKVETSTAPADYHLTASWGALPASTQFSATYSEYAVGGLASDSYDIRLTRGADVEIPSITIRGIYPLNIGDTLQNFSTSPVDIGIISAVIASGSPTWHATPPSANTNPNTLAANYTAKAGEKLYAKIVLDPAKGYKFSDTIAVTCVGPDLDYTGTGTAPEISYAGVTTYVKDGHLNAVLEFTVKLGEVDTVTLTLARPAVDGNPNSLRVTTVSDATMLQNPATVNWTLGGAPWSQVLAKKGDVFTAQVTIRAIEGYEFGTAFNTIAAADFATSAAKINFPGADEIGTTAPTAILSNDRKALTITVTFAAIP
jgi:hypothetical protein